MDPSDQYYKSKRNLLLFVACLLLAIFAGFKIAEGDQKISVLPFQLAHPEFLTHILLIAVLFDLFQFSLNWASQKAEVQQNRFHRIDFTSTTTIAVLSLGCYGWWLVSDKIRFETKISLGDIIGIAVALIVTLLASFVGSRKLEGISERIGRWLKRKAASEDEELASVLKSGIWTLIYNPDHPAGSKKITFEKDGEIGFGRNDNEDTWRIRHGLLEIMNKQNQVFSRFVFDRKSSQFLHTNDEDTLSIRSQKIVPLKG